jgi:hypothetical protein
MIYKHGFHNKCAHASDNYSWFAPQVSIPQKKLDTRESKLRVMGQNERTTGNPRLRCNKSHSMNELERL